MSERPFDATPEFARFKEVMRGVIAVPKVRLDELVKEAEKASPRRGNPHAPGRKGKAKDKA
jgi:hypothetical protein